MQIVESSNPKEIRLTGVFGVAGVKNNNNRIYDKQNYGMMVESLQRVIATEGCLGELEHPNSMNIDLNNVSHKIESIEMMEDGTVKGTIVLIDTDKGRNAKAIIEAGVPLYISSRASGSIDESGHVTLTNLKTYDLVGTPGFSQARLGLSENQTFESINESMCIIYESDDEDKDGKKKEKEKDDEKNVDVADPKDDEKGDGGDSEKDDKKDDDDNNKNNDKETASMAEIKELIEKLQKQVEDLQADLHVAKESKQAVEDLTKQINEFQAPKFNYNKVQEWIDTEFKTNFSNEIMEAVNDKIKTEFDHHTTEYDKAIKEWVVNDFSKVVETYVNDEFAPSMEKWVIEQYSPIIQEYMTEEFAPTMEKWVIESYSPQVEKFMIEQFAPEIEEWVNEELAPVVDSWINEVCITEHKENIVNEVNNNINQFMEAKKEVSLTSIDNLLEAIEGKAGNEVNEAIKLLNESKTEEKYKGEYVVEHMPDQYRPQWEMISEAKQLEIIQRSRMYDFNKNGVLESFWANIDFEAKPINESVQVAPERTYHNNIFSMMEKLRK